VLIVLRPVSKSDGTQTLAPQSGHVAGRWRCPAPYLRGPGIRAAWSWRTRATSLGARQSAAATVANRVPKSPGATMCTRVRFPGSQL